MFAKTIIESDAFSELPLTAQALYLHICMNADDEGFINNAKQIQRLIGASETDLKALKTKRFIIVFKSGVVCVKHWLIHNAIRKDRQKSTVYQEERCQLTVKNNGAYTIDRQIADKLQTNDSQYADTLAHRLDKSRLDKFILDKTRQEKKRKEKKSATKPTNDSQYADTFKKLDLKGIEN